MFLKFVNQVWNCLVIHLKYYRNGVFKKKLISSFENSELDVNVNNIIYISNVTYTFDYTCKWWAFAFIFVHHTFVVIRVDYESMDYNYSYSTLSTKPCVLQQNWTMTLFIVLIVDVGLSSLCSIYRIILQKNPRFSIQWTFNVHLTHNYRQWYKGAINYIAGKIINTCPSWMFIAKKNRISVNPT